MDRFLDNLTRSQAVEGYCQVNEHHSLSLSWCNHNPVVTISILEAPKWHSSTNNNHLQAPDVRLSNDVRKDVAEVYKEKHLSSKVMGFGATQTGLGRQIEKQWLNAKVLSFGNSDSWWCASCT
ncbi:hypothetical protein ACA910_011986 [Epithemia clementina (nom. ined.)]